MSQAPIMPFYTDAYLADTHHLSTIAHGAYMLLLLHTWRCNGIAPKDDDRLLARVTKLPLQQWKRVRAELEPFFTFDDGHWRQKRLEETWAQVQQKIELQRAKGAKGNAARRRKKELSFKQSSITAAIPQDTVPRTPSINHEPLTNKPLLKETLKKGDGNRSEQTSSLSILSPILSDISYFVGDSKTLSATLRTHIPLALEEISQLLAPINEQALDDRLDQLWRLFPKADTDPSLRQDYALWFEHYPADLIEQACDRLLRNHPYPTLPRLADFAAIMDPLMRQRQLQKQRLEKLRKKQI